MLYAIIYVCSLALADPCTPDKSVSKYTYYCESQVPTGCLLEASQALARMASFDGRQQQPLVTLAHH